MDGGLHNPAALDDINMLSNVDITIHLKERNRLATDCIKRWASEHGKMDVAMGAAGTIASTVIPMASIATTGAAILAQIPAIYNPMSRELAEIYYAPSGQVSQWLSGKRAVTVYGYAPALDYAAEFGSDFVANIISENLVAIGIGTVFSPLPLVSGIIGALVDWNVASGMTRLVGTMCCAYYQRDGVWKDGLKQAVKEAKRNCNPVNAEKTSEYPDIHERHVRNLLSYIEMTWAAGATKDKIYKSLLAVAPKNVVDEAMRVFGNRTGWKP